MASTQTRRAIGTFPTLHAAEQALHELERSGFPMEKVSVIARDSGTNKLAGADVSEPVGNKADEGAKTGAISGGALGGLTGLLVGLGVLAIPGIGPVMLAGAGATVLATALSGTAIGAATGGLLGALVGLGIPEKEAKIYSDRVSRGDYLVMVQGTGADIQHAEQILKRHIIQDWGVYNTNEASHVETVEQASLTPPGNRVDRTTPLSVQSTAAESVRLHEEQLRVEKVRQKAGEVVVSKHVETDLAKVAVPIKKERIVIRRTTPSEIGKPVAPSESNFSEGEMVRMEAYEETADIQKQAFVREEVNLHKEVDRGVVNVEETVRREQLDVNIQGHPRVDGADDFLPDRA